MKIYTILFLFWLLWVTLWCLQEVSAAARRREQQAKLKNH